MPMDTDQTGDDGGAEPQDRESVVDLDDLFAMLGHPNIALETWFDHLERRS